MDVSQLYSKMASESIMTETLSRISALIKTKICTFYKEDNQNKFVIEPEDFSGYLLVIFVIHFKVLSREIWVP
jgi:hypothetical protein